MIHIHITTWKRYQNYYSLCFSSWPCGYRWHFNCLFLLHVLYFVFPLSLKTSSAAFGSLPREVTHTFIPEGSGVSIFLPVLSCWNFSLTLIARPGVLRDALGTPMNSGWTLPYFQYSVKTLYPLESINVPVSTVMLFFTCWINLLPGGAQSGLGLNYQFQ